MPLQNLTHNYTAYRIYLERKLSHIISSFVLVTTAGYYLYFKFRQPHLIFVSLTIHVAKNNRSNLLGRGRSGKELLNCAETPEPTLGKLYSSIITITLRLLYVYRAFPKRMFYTVFRKHFVFCCYVVSALKLIQTKHCELHNKNPLAFSYFFLQIQNKYCNKPY